MGAARRSGGGRPSGGRPSGGRPSGGKSSGGRPSGGRSSAGRSSGGKSPGGKSSGGKSAEGPRARRGPAGRRPAPRDPDAPPRAQRGPPRGAKAGPKGAAGPRKRPAPRKALRVTALPVTVETDGKVRLNKFLASTGVSSRRAADDLIARGRITVNGAVVRELGLRIDPGADEVRLDGQRLAEEKKVYVLFNKPKGVVCTNARNEQRARVIDFLEGVRGRIYTIGRLDADSEGLILLTNDGDFAQEMAHPRYGVPKTYAVLVRGTVEHDVTAKVRGGVWLAEGRTSGATVRVERRSHDRTYLKVTLREGRNREIRRVFAKLGNPVLSLKRVRIGALSLHGLGSGEHRFLRPEELRSLRETARAETE